MNRRIAAAWTTAFLLAIAATASGGEVARHEFLSRPTTRIELDELEELRQKLRASEVDMRARRARGVAAWGLMFREWMNVPWFEGQGYSRVDVQGVMGLAFKAFDPDVDDPRWLQEVKRPEPIPGKVRVSSFVIGWCTSGNLNHEWARRAARELGEDVVFETFDTSDPGVVAEWGITTGIYVDGERYPVDGSETYEGFRDFIRSRMP